MRRILFTALCIGLILLLSSCGSQKANKYQEAIKLYESGDVNEAKATFESLGDYEDSKKYIELCDSEIKYQEGIAAVENGDYKTAIKIFEELGDFKDCETKAYNTKFDSLISAIREQQMYTLSGSPAIYIGNIANNAGDEENYAALIALDDDTLMFSREQTAVNMYSDPVYIISDLANMIITRGDDAANVGVNTQGVTMDGFNEYGSFKDGGYQKDIIMSEYEYNDPIIEGDNLSIREQQCNSLLAGIMANADSLLEMTGTGVTIQDLGFIKFEAPEPIVFHS